MYEQNSFEPVARIVQLASHIEQKRLADIAYETRRFVRIGESEETINQRIADNSKPLINIYHYHCNHLGTPQELTNQDGDVIWLSYDRAWGGSFDTIYKPQFIDNWAISESELQPIKFQGQSLDTETGLHYNRFRYYDSDVGMFISRDPIGLLGGSNVFQYAPNPVGWIDPWGLVKKKCTDPIQKLEDRGYTGVVRNSNGGLDYSASNALYKKKPEVNPIQTIEYTGNYHKDFEEASMKALGQKSTPRNYVWHHLDDYDPKTNTGTMQLVEQNAHTGITHTGGVSQYQKATGNKYEFKTW